MKKPMEEIKNAVCQLINNQKNVQKTNIYNIKAKFNR